MLAFVILVVVLGVISVTLVVCCVCQDVVRCDFLFVVIVIV